MEGVDQTPVILAAYGLTLQGVRVSDSASRLLGRLVAIHGNALQCECKVHQKCRLIKNYVGTGGLREAESTLIKWLVLGTVESADEHAASAKSLQEAWKSDNADVRAKAAKGQTPKGGKAGIRRLPDS